MCFVNKMDRAGANFTRCVSMIKKMLDSVPAVIQLPIGRESDFTGVIDLVKMVAIEYHGENLGATWTEVQYILLL